MFSHIPPDPEAIEANKAREPDGERLRAELTEWLDKNSIVGIMMATPNHSIEIRCEPRLPPHIKPVLTVWGSIYVVEPDQTDNN